MRRMAMVAVLVVALLALGAGVVLAQDEPAAQGEEETVSAANNEVIQCRKVPCRASGNRDLVYERVGAGKRDKILLGGGNDQVRADHYGKDRDVVRGSAGFDLIYVSDRDTRDKIFGGKGKDKCYVDAPSEVGGGCSAVIVVP